MNFLELEYQTWQRQQTYGMFDYSEQKAVLTYPKIFIKTSGVLFRNITTYQLAFNEGPEVTPPQGYLAFLKVEFKQGHFFVANLLNQCQNQPLAAIAPTLKGLKLKQGDHIRLGKAKLELLRLSWAQKNRGNHYQTCREPNMAESPSIFAASFYSQKEKASLVESNPSCRYCYSKTIDDENPFMALCNCSGHTKYIHLGCLVEWVRKRSGISEDYLKQGIYCVQAKAFTCQVCKSLYRVDRLLRQVFKVDKEKLQQFAAFMVDTDSPMIYIVDLKKEEGITIGRSLESLMVINQLSVSRKHSKLLIDRTTKQLSIIDLKSKFGTVIEIIRQQIYKKHDFQKGRTKMRFTKKTKISVLEKLGFCSAHENLHNEHKQ